MTSSVVEICNRALSEMGTQKRISSLDEVSVAANACALWYDNQRTSLLRSAPWGFARRQCALTLLGDLANDTSPYPFLFKYLYPADCLKFRYVLCPPIPTNSSTAPAVGLPVGTALWLSPSRQNRFIIHNDVDTEGNSRKVLLTNVPNAIGVYNGDITDPSQFDAMFDNALTASLAHKLVVPLSGNAGMKEGFRASAEDAIIKARAVDANESIPKADHVVDWIATRGVGSAWGNNPALAPTWGQWNGGFDDMNWSS